MLSKRLFLGLAGIGAVCVLAFFAFAWRPAIALIDPPAPSSLPRELVAKGEILASVGDCAVCHTSNLTLNRPYAGGYSVVTPFGYVYSTNITPDHDTGIGRWSEAAFSRAMREGVSRDGSHLFPAFPYDHFTKLTDDDIKALYAYLMNVPSVKATTPPNTVSFPLDIRALQAGWKTLFFDKGPYRPDRAKGAEWNRGAYLVEGIAHCGSCHTRRNVFGAEQVGHPYGGELVEGWIAWPLDVSPSPARWTKDDFVTYLRGGTTVHGRATGPMGTVVKSLARLPDSDIQAIATYFVEFERSRSPNADRVVATALAASTPQSDIDQDRGARLYATACGSCHENVGPGRAQLALSSALWYDYPYNFLRAVLDGVGSERDAPGPRMPALRDTLSDADITAIGNYLRRTRTNQRDWLESENWAAKVRANPQEVPWAR